MDKTLALIGLLNQVFKLGGEFISEEAERRNMTREQLLEAADTQYKQNATAIDALQGLGHEQQL